MQKLKQQLTRLMVKKLLDALSTFLKLAHSNHAKVVSAVVTAAAAVVAVVSANVVTNLTVQLKNALRLRGVFFCLKLSIRVYFRYMLHVSAPMGDFSDDILTYREKLRSLAFDTQDLSQDECSVVLPEMLDALQASIQLCEEKCSKALQYHIVVGIGGSSLGTKGIYEALF